MKKFIIIILLIFISFQAKSQTIYPLNDFKEIIISPFKISKISIIPVSLFISASAIVYLNDNSIKKNIQKLKDPNLDKVLRFSKNFGNGWVILPVGFSGIFLGETVLNRKFTILGIYIIEGFLFSGIIGSSIQIIFGRARPYVNKGPYFYKPFRHKVAYNSFYSGHTTESFAFASIISHYFQNIIISSCMYSIAFLTAIERVYNNKHWPLDVIVGGTAGFLIGRKIVGLNVNYIGFSANKEDLRISFKIKEF